MAATRSSSDATSNGNRYVVKNSLPMCSGLPKPGTYGAPLPEMPFSAVPSMAMHSSIVTARPNSGPITFSAPPGRCSGSS